MRFTPFFIGTMPAVVISFIIAVLVLHCFLTQDKTSFVMTLLGRLLALLIGVTTVTAADLHPILEVQSGYLFGASSDGKWLKAAAERDL